MSLIGKNVLLGVTGSIAAYKAADLTSLLRKAGANVDVVMTDGAAQFVTPSTLETLSRNPVHRDQFDHSRWEPEHTRLADDADLFVIAPATANLIAKFANGIADDLLSTLLVAARCPILVAPAMNVHMYDSPMVQENLAKLVRLGVTIAEPAYGMLACGYEGRGRLQPVDDLFEAIERLEETSTYRAHHRDDDPRDMDGKRVLVTAGPTREPLDPVRFLTNRSSGKMGYALAEAAARRGAQVTLVSGPTVLPTPPGVHRIDVTTAREMLNATMNEVEDAEIIVLAAAVADYEAAEIADQKIKKTDDALTLTLRKTTDIAREVGAIKGDRLSIGFAAETENGVENARRKLIDKNLDLIALNDVTQPGAGFETDTNVVTLIDPDGNATELPILPKLDVARRIFDAALSRLALTEMAT